MVGSNPDSVISNERALDEFAKIGLSELERTSSKEVVRSILGLLALWKGARIYSQVLIEFREDEVVELSAQAFR